MKNRLRVLRAEREWSQQDLAERLGVSRQSVNAIETGRYDPSLPLAFRIADVFGKYYVPQIGAFVIYAVMVVMLIYRPQGLFGRRAAR